MKRIMGIVLICIMIFGLLAGCSEAESQKIAGKLALGGSTSVEKVIQSMMESYMAKNKDVTITYAPTGSSTGIQGAAENTLDIGLSSRGLKDEEKSTLKEIIFALDGIAVIINSENTVTDLDLAALALIAKGEIKNWSEVGGTDTEIVVIGRDAASGTRDGFESIVDVKDECVYAEEQASSGAVIASVQSNKGAIGYVSLSSVDEKVKALTIEGVEPSEATVKDGSYKIQRPFVFAVKNDSDNALADDFIKWSVSSATIEIVRNAGAVPVAGDEIEVVTETAPDDLSGKLTLGGSTSVEKVIQSMMEAFMGEFNDVSMTYAPTGSSTGIQGSAEGTLDIGLSSRGLKDEEKATLKEIIFALDGIAVIVNSENTVTDLDLAALASIAKGEIKNWSEVGGTDTEIVVIGRDAASGTRDGFESIVGVKEACVYAEEQASTGAVIASVQSNKGAIGYVSLSSVDEKVKALTIEGIEPSEATVKDGSYKIQRPFVFAVKNDSSNALADYFIKWAVSSATNEIVRNAGTVPVAGDEIKAVTEAVPDDLSGKLTLGGSTSVEKVIQSMMEAFMGEFNDVSMTYAPTGSSTGIQGATEGSLDIGLSSRGLKDEEKAALDEIIFAIDGIAIIVNNKNTITDLDLVTLASIAKGEIKNWSEVGGDDMEIVMIGRDAASGTRDGFESIVGVKEACVYAEEQASTGAVIASIQSNKGAIGYVSLASVDEKVKTLTIEEVEPSEATVKDGSYKIQRPFVFAVKNDSDNVLADYFIKWAVSSATNEIVRNAGAVPVA